MACQETYAQTLVLNRVYLLLLKFSVIDGNVLAHNPARDGNYIYSLKKISDLLKIMELVHSRAHVIRGLQNPRCVFSHSTMVAFQYNLEFYL